MGVIQSGSISYDIDVREAQVVGSEPRIGPLAPGKIDDDAMAMIVRIRGSIGVKDNSAIPEYFTTMIRHPALFASQLDMGTTLFKGKIPPRARELAVLRIGYLCRAPYEWGEHVDISQRYGVTRDEVERVTQGSSAPGWGELDRAILRGVEELLGDQAISDETWAVLAAHWDAAQLIEFPVLVGQYVATAFLQNTLRMRLAEDNPGLRYR